MEYIHLGSPCRNFCIFGAAFVNDPLDSRMKLVLTSFVASGTGTLILIDTITGEGESLELPGDEGAWALLNLNNEKLLVGTCSRYGYLHCLDLKTRKWHEPLRDESEAYVWNLVRGSDGMVYGGTYPGCRLLKYDPEAHTLENMGRASEDCGNLYSRRVFAEIPGKILINCGYNNPHIAEFDLCKRTIRPLFAGGAQIVGITRDFICINAGKELEYYEPASFNKLEPEQFRNIREESAIKANPLISAEDGSTAGVWGQEYFFMKSSASVPVFKRIPVQPPATAILTLTSDSDGRLWGSSALGQTIFSYDTESGEYWNSTNVCESGGEVYGMCCIGGRLFMSSYCNGDHIVFDMSKPWERAENKNPRTLKPLAPDLVRPSAKSTVGPDGSFWTGWMAKYGIYGGGLSRVDADTLEVTSWYDPVPGQSLSAITADCRYVYFTTYGYANGLDIKKEPFHLCVWEPGTGMVEKIEFPEGVIPWNLCIAGRNLLVAAGNEIRVFDRSTMNNTDIWRYNSSCRCMTDLDEGRTALFLQDEVMIIDSENGAVKCSMRLPGKVETAVCNSRGGFYFASGSDLYEIRP